MKKECFLKMGVLRTILLLLCFLITESVYSRQSRHHARKKHHSSHNSHRNSSKNSCRKSGSCKERSKSSQSSFMNQAVPPTRIIRGIDGKNGERGQKGERGEKGDPGQPCECSSPSEPIGFISVSSNEVQIYKGDGTTFQDITFNQGDVAQGWKHEPETPNFECPQSGLYQVTYTAGAGKFQKDGGITIRARFGPLGAEEVVKGSDTSVYGKNFIKSTGTTFLLQGIEGQNFKLEFVGEPGETTRLISTGTAETTVSLTIVKIQ